MIIKDIITVFFRASILRQFLIQNQSEYNKKYIKTINYIKIIFERMGFCNCY